MRRPMLMAGLVLVACGNTPWAGVDAKDDWERLPEGPGVQKNVQLLRFEGDTACETLEAHVKERAVTQMQVQVAFARSWAMQDFDRRDQPQTGGLMDAGVSGSGGAGGGSSSGAGGQGPADYTTTNTQVAGVDEADFVKNDGTRIFVLSGQKLFATTSWPATALARRGDLTITGRPREMFLDGDQVVVFSTGHEPGFSGPSWCQGNSYCAEYYPNSTFVTHVDVSDLSSLRVTSVQRLPGGYHSARRVGQSVRLITSNDIYDVPGVRSWIDWDAQRRATSRAELAALFAHQAAQNEVLIRAAPLRHWLPTPRWVIGTTEGDLSTSCEDVVAPNTSARLGLTSVFTLDMGDPKKLTRQAMLASVDETYANQTSLYLAQRHWWWGGAGQDYTYFYRFDLSAPDRARFLAAGAVEGRPVDQFALDEHGGVLRVATTVTSTGSGGDWWRSNTVNRVVTLQQQGQALVELGRTEDLAPGERIMSARFIGDVGYVVTFRQVDPLYTLDLSDPARPRKVGELKIPGFSSYIHPLDATHLLTIGTYVPENGTDWRERALQLAIFDVSDLAAPRQTHVQLVGHAWGWSEAQREHKAFNYFGAKGLLAIPFFDWYSNGASWSYVSDLRVFHVDPLTGFTPKGALDMADVLNNGCSSGWGCWSWYWQPQVRRSVMADDFVYAIGSGGIRAAHVNALSTPLATVRFDPAP